MTIASCVNGDSFCCMMCRKNKPIEDGVRRSLNEFIDVFHCVSCLTVNDKEIKSQVLHGLSVANNPVLDKMVDEIASEAVAMFMRRRH